MWLRASGAPDLPLRIKSRRSAPTGEIAYLRGRESQRSNPTDAGLTTGAVEEIFRLEPKSTSAIIWYVFQTIPAQQLTPEQLTFGEQYGAEPLQTSPVDGSVFFYRDENCQTSRFLVNRDGRVLEARKFAKSLAA